MRGRRRAIVFLLGCVIAAVVVLLGAPAFAEDPFPVFYLDTYDNQLLGNQTEIGFEVFLLQGSAPAASIAITEPAGYSTSLASEIGKQLGVAAITAAPLDGGKAVEYPGSLVTTDPTADTLASSCSPGSHAATWHLALSSLSSVVVPIVVDRLANGTYRMTACLDSLRTAGLKATDLYFTVRTVFGNPKTKGVYRWSAIVTPTSAAGTPDTGTAFELRADEPLPETLDAHPAYAKGILTVKGKLIAAGSPRSGIRVHIYVGASSDPRKMKELGAAVTSASGSYVFKKKTAKPRYVMAYVQPYRGPSCDQPSQAPAGCASESTDGAGSGAVRAR